MFNNIWEEDDDDDDDDDDADGVGVGDGDDDDDPQWPAHVSDVWTTNEQWVEINTQLPR